MKCLCGYEYRSECRDPNKFHKPFIKLELAEKVSGYVDSTTDNLEDCSTYTTLYACPICGTLKIELGD